MRSRVLTAMAIAVILVVGFSVAIGLTRPDGSVGDHAAPNVVTSRSPAASATPSAPAPSTDAPPPADRPTRDLAPTDVQGVWPGRPGKAKVSGQDIDWCPAVKVSANSSATSVFGTKRVRSGACAAVTFVMEQRYSRLSLPKATYKTGDFADAVAWIAPQTRDAFYRSRVAAYVARPSQANARQLGLVLLPPMNGRYVFYGPSLSQKGYRDRAVWINPQWSTVSVSTSLGRTAPRLVARFTASAAVPVFDTARRSDAMMTVPTGATLTMLPVGDGWKVSSFVIDDTAPTVAPLKVR